MPDGTTENDYMETRENLANLEKSFDLQRKMTEKMNERGKIAERLGKLDTNTQRKLNTLLAETKAYLDQMGKSHEKLGLQMNKYGKAEIGQMRDTAKRMQVAQKDQIRNVNYQLTMLDEELQKEQKILDEIKARHDFFGKSIKERFFLEVNEIENYKKLNEEISKMFPNMKGWQVGLITSLMILSLFARAMYDSFEKSAAAFRKFAGMFRDTARPLRKMAEDIAIQYRHVGVELDGVYTAIKALGTEMGGLHNVSKDLVTTTALMSAQLGVSEENTAGMLRNLAIASKSTMQAQKSMAYFAADLSAAAGVPLNLVMGDIAKMSGTAFAMMSKMPLAIIKSAVEARKLNTTLNDMARASRSILDFQNNVNAEMEASVLIGQSINLQRARYLAYNKDLVGSTKEILNVAKKIDFQHLDVFQMEAFATASGRSVEELTKMLQAEKQMEEARASQDPAVQRQLKAYEEMKAANDATAKSSADNLEAMLIQKANQERMVAVQNQWNKVLMEASRIFLPIIDIALQLLGAFIAFYPALMPVVGLFKLIGMGLMRITAIASVVNNIKLFIVAIQASTIGFWGQISKIFGVVSKIFGVVSKFGMFFKWVPILGWVITGAQILYKIFTKWRDIWNDPSMNIGEKILAGLIAVAVSIWEVLTEPFKMAWEWIKSLWGGNSPSKIALSMVKGIASAGAMMFDALTYPWRHFLAWMVDTVSFLPGMKSIATKLRGGMGGMMGGNVEATAQKGMLVPAVQVTPNGVTTVAGAKPTAAGQAEEKSNSEDLLQKQLDAINTNNNLLSQLSKDLTNGKIAVYVDGSLLSSTLARKLEFKGNFGMNV